MATWGWVVLIVLVLALILAVSLMVMFAREYKDSEELRIELLRSLQREKDTVSQLERAATRRRQSDAALDASISPVAIRKGTPTAEVPKKKRRKKIVPTMFERLLDEEDITSE